jgi:DNA mismatch repair protein MutS
MKEKLIDTYFEITEKNKIKYGEKTILLMQVGAFFEVYGKKHKKFGANLIGSNIDDFCNICELNKSIKTKVSVEHDYNGEKISCDICMAGFRDYVLEKYVDKLTERGYTVVVYAQEKEDTTKRYELGIFTPGTQIKEDTNIISNNIMCISLFHQKPSKMLKTTKNIIHYGISVINVLTGTTEIYEYNEQYYNSLTTYDELERQYSVHNPNETIICYDSTNIPNKIIEGIINYIGIYSKLIRKIDNSLKLPLSIQALNCEKQKYQNEILKKFYNELEYNEIINNVFNLERGIQSFCFLLDYTSSYNQNLTNKLRLPIINKLHNKLVLGNHSLKQLNIIPLYKSEGKTSSVLDFINNASTSMGKREINKLIVNPITNSNELEKSYSITEYCIKNFDTYQEIRKQLVSVIDIEKFYRRLANKQITPCDIYSFYLSLNTIQDIYKKIKKEDFLIVNNIINKEIQKSIHLLIDNIKNIFNIKLCSNLQNDMYSTNIFNRNCYKSIDIIEQSYYDSYDKINVIINEFDNIIKKTELTKKNGNYCKLHETDKSGYMIKITETRSKKLIQELNKLRENNEIIHLKFNSSYDNNEYNVEFPFKNVKSIKRGTDTLITSTEIDNYLELIFKKKIELKKEVEIEFFNYCKKLLDFQNDFEKIINFIINVDVMICKAYVSIKYNYCKPQIDNSKNKSFIEAKQMRHLLIEQINQQIIYVPNDILLDDNESGILLFGTNAVGKSSLIKSIGICVILAQAGFFVPCKSFIYKPFTRIFTRILGNDNIFKGLSTFAVEMSELRTILQYSDENSLVLGDELCSGTELGSAISIFLAGLTTLYERKSKFIFATHFHEITSMPELKKLKSILLKHMSIHYDATIDALVYDRIIKDGPGNNMYGLEVCKALNLPSDFLDLAYEIRNNNNNDRKPISSQNVSKYNSQKIKGNCELCGSKGIDIHHMQYQRNSNNDGFIESFHKNHTANLMNICENCHTNIHKNNIEYKRVYTTKGIKILEK